MNFEGLTVVNLVMFLILTVCGVLMSGCGDDEEYPRVYNYGLQSDHGQFCYYYEIVYLENLPNDPPGYKRRKGILQEGRMDCSEPNRNVVLPCNCVTREEFDKDWPGFIPVD